ncbi:glycosyltransferase family 39 protein [Rhodocytophaga rosea]|uniref:Glycosyltransferase family 39 protein n=1 Tax=Rhodocytophaga rosea TaxID=2704465 RepID=A0A6C0GHM8_9BACT|nr:glycosyltransferase family 39 protein [Rhodocytophaga rosea]QHT67508.1 glycosyltransferase family 39 protein [Rhodocytophaga rosea]
MSPKVIYSIIIGLLAALFFLPFLGGVHLFDWDEINFAECAREMIILKDYLRIYINYEPFWEKPPLFIWMQAFSMKIFGVGEYAARFPNAVCGILTLIVLFLIGNKLYDKKFGLFWAGAYGGSILPHLYFKSGIIDPFFNLFIFLAIYLLILFYWKKDSYSNIFLPKNAYLYLISGGIILGLAILTKGPAAYIIVCLTLFIYWILQKFRFYINILHFLLFTVSATLVTLIWYGVETAVHGPFFINEFFTYQYRLFSTPDAGHAGFPGYHFVVLLIGCFPASIFCIRAFGKQDQPYIYQRDFRIWMIILFWVVLILFTIVKSKIVHYSSMCYFPLTYLAALTMYQITERKIAFTNWMKYSLIAIGGLFCLATLVLPFVGMKVELLAPLFSKDPFAKANLAAHVNWTGFESIAGLFLFLVLGLSIKWLLQKKYDQGFGTLYIGTAMFVMLTLIFFIGRIELYSQGAAIRFFESLQGKDVYVITDGYKSYAQLFYSRKPPVTNPKSYDYDWLLRGDIDKDVYFVTKVDRKKELETMEGLEKLGSENGFVFYRRKAKK